MFLVRTQQQSTLQQSAVVTFVDRMRLHILAQFPSKAIAMGNGGIQNFIESLLTVAKTFGIETERDIVRLANVLLIIHIAPEAVPTTDWLRQLLMDTTVPNISDRIARVVSASIVQLSVAANNQQAREQYYAASG